MKPDQTSRRTKLRAKPDPPSSAPTAPSRGRAIALAITALAVVAGAVLRAAASRDNFWLDEIWSWHNVSQLSSPGQVFTAIHLDNNHYLNSLFIYAAGLHAHWVIYRIPSVVAGVLAIVYTGLILREQGWRAVAIGVVLIAFSYVQVHYSSEARGYALCLFFALFSYYYLRRYLAEGRLAALVLFQVGCLLGIVAHLEFLTFLLACAAWVVYREVTRRLDQRSRLRHRPMLSVARELAAPVMATMARFFILPALALAILYAVDLRLQRIGGGNPVSTLQTMWLTLGLAVGAGPRDEPLVWPGLVTIALLIGGLRVVARRSREDALFYAVVLVAAPILQVQFVARDLVPARYFFVPLGFFCLLMARAGAQLSRQRRAYAVVAGGLMLVYLIGNGVSIERLLRYGRGGYLAALTYMMRATPQRVVTVSSDHDFRNQMVIDYYRPYLPQDKVLKYESLLGTPRPRPEWVIAHTTSFAPPASPTLDLGLADGYEKVREYPYSGLSGFRWIIYRRSDG